MTTPQHRIGSGFGARGTAAEVLSGIDLSGRLAVVTGGYSGLGLETTRALAGAGAHVVVPARRPGVARVGPGWEAQFATNHLGHFALVNRLWPAIVRGGGRVVSVSSGAHRISPIRWDDPHFTAGYDKWQAYGQAKTANVLFAVHLDALAKYAGVRAFAVHPGRILTPLQRHLPKEEMVAAGWIDEAGNLVAAHFKTPEQGAATQVWAATSPQLDGMGGVYCEDCDVAGPATDSSPGGVSPYATGPGEATRLWALSAELTGVDAFAVRA